MNLNSLSEIHGGDEHARELRGDAQVAGGHRGLRIVPRAASELRGRRVLVVDDNAFNREVVSELLLAVNMQVDTAVDGADALRMIETGRYHVVLMDIHMPQMNGLAAARAIRSQARFARLPLIALTARVSAPDRDASLAAGMSAHLTKPIDEALLYAALLELLGAPVTAAPAGKPAGSGATGAALPQAPPSPALSAPGQPAGAFSLARLGDDPERLRRVLAQFLHDTADTPARLSQYLEAGELHGAAALVHPLRGAALYLSAGELCDVAGRIESAAAQGDAAMAASQLQPLRRSLKALRGYIAVQLAQLPRGGAPAAAAADDALPALLERAIPLVAQGDYAAQRLLEQILQQLTHGAELQLARAALAHFADLELEQAQAALRELAAARIRRP